MMIYFSNYMANFVLLKLTQNNGNLIRELKVFKAINKRVDYNL